MKKPHYKQDVIQLNEFNTTVAGVKLFLTFIKSDLQPLTWHGNGHEEHTTTVLWK